MKLNDRYNREFKKLRVSLTNLCNLSCVYCVPDGKETTKLTSRFSDKNRVLATIKDLNAHLSLEKIRLTGGEPLLHPEIKEIIEGIANLGIEQISITTNGIGMSEKIIELKSLGLTSVNISLDASTDHTFEQITGFNKFDKVISAVEKCVETGLEVKLNSVILKGQNEDEILPLLDFAQKTGIEIRFLELMKMGKVKSYFDHFYISADDIVQQISTQYSVIETGRPETSTTRYYELNTGYRFGIIQNESKPFCKDCDRLRLGSDHKLYGCITAEEGIEIPTETNRLDWETTLGLAMNQKQDVFKGSQTSMITIGG